MIVSAGVFLGQYKKAKSALEGAKEQLGEFLQNNNMDGLEVAPNTGVRWVERTNRAVLLDKFDEELVLWAWRNGLLQFPIGKFDELADDVRASLKPYLGTAPGTAYVNLYYPDWGTANQAKKEQARAASPVNAPVPINTPRAAQQAQGDLPSCPTHGANRTLESKKFNGLFCSAKDDDKYCTWQWKASA